MQKNVLSFILISLLFIGCKEAKSVETNILEPAKVEMDSAQKFAIDSVSVNDSVRVNKNLTVNYISKALVFKGIKNKAILDSIYYREEINLEEYSSENILAELKKAQQKFFDDNKKNSKDLPTDFPQNWYANSDMKMFSHENDFLTIKYTHDGFSGGAHGYYNEFYKVFDLKNNKTLQLSDVLITPDSSVWKLALMDHFLKNDIGKGQADMLLVKEISPNNNFYFDKENIYFLYNQYDIAAYAAGPVLIKLPFKEVKLMLHADFVKRAGIQ